MIDSLLTEHPEYLLSGLLLVLLFAPILTFLLTGWTARRREILDSFAPSSIGLYFKLFLPAREQGGADDLQIFLKEYHRRYGRQHYVLPLLTLMALAAISLLLAFDTVVHWANKQDQAFLLLPPISVSALAGCFMWCMSDQLARFWRKDIRPVDVYWYAFRFAVVVPLGFAFAAAFKDDLGIPVAFFIGVFPTRSLLVLCRRFGAKKLDLENVVEGQGLQLKKLQGVHNSQAERFSEEGVETVLQLAYAEPIELTIRTGFSFSYVVDCCSQALAWLYFEDALSSLRKSGLRGAQEIWSLVDELGKDGTKKSELARKTLAAAAKSIEMDASAFEYALHQVAEDPYTEFLCDVWMPATEPTEAIEACEESEPVG